MIGMDSAFGRSGAHDWWMQRVSAIILLIYSVALGISIYCAGELSYVSFTQVFAPMWMQVATVVSVAALAIHAWAGLWIVSTDYIKPKVLRNLFQLIVLVTCIGLIVWSIKIFWG